MALQGDVETFSIRELLSWLCERRASGTLSLSRGMVARRFHLREGRVVLASSSEQTARLGRLLVDRGLLAPEQLQSALDDPSRARLGKRLLTSGIVPRAALRAVLVDQVRSLLADALAWTDGRFAFDEGTPALKRAALTVAVDLGEVLAHPPEEGVSVTDEDVLEITELA